MIKGLLSGIHGILMFALYIFDLMMVLFALFLLYLFFSNKFQNAGAGLAQQWFVLFMALGILSLLNLGIFLLFTKHYRPDIHRRTTMTLPHSLLYPFIKGGQISTHNIAVKGILKCESCPKLFRLYARITELWDLAIASALLLLICWLSASEAFAYFSAA